MQQLIQLARFAGVRVATRLNLKSERGATAVEYGVMVALIAAVIITAVAFLGKETSDTFQCTGNSIAAESDKC